MISNVMAGAVVKLSQIHDQGIPEEHRPAMPLHDMMSTYQYHNLTLFALGHYVYHNTMSTWLGLGFLKVNVLARLVMNLLSRIFSAKSV